MSKLAHPFFKSSLRNTPWVMLALIVGALSGIFLSRLLPHGHQSRNAYDHELAEVFKSSKSLDLSEDTKTESAAPLRPAAELEAEFKLLATRLTPGTAYPLTQVLKPWLEQDPEAALRALESLTDCPDSFPLALLIAECGEVHGSLLWEFWQQKPELLGPRFAVGVAEFMQGGDWLGSYEARYWSHALPAEMDGSFFRTIVLETSTLQDALSLAHSLRQYPAKAQDAVYRALGHKHGSAVLQIPNAPDGLLMGMLERESHDSYEDALTQALHLSEGTCLPRFMALLWDQDEEALRTAIEEVENTRKRRKLTKALFVEALDRVEPTEILDVWEECRSLGGRRPLSEDELREATNDNPLYAFPILATAFGERMQSRGPALDYGERCSRSVGERLLKSDHVGIELKLGLQITLHQGPVEELVTKIHPQRGLGNESVRYSAVAAVDWARVNPNEALELATQLEGSDNRNFALRGIGSSPTGAMLPDIGKLAIDAIDDPKEREGAIEGWAYWLGMHNPHEGSKILAAYHSEQPLPDETIARFVQTSAEADIDGAMAWLDLVNDPKIRKETLGYLKSILAKH